MYVCQTKVKSWVGSGWLDVADEREEKSGVGGGWFDVVDKREERVGRWLVG